MFQRWALGFFWHYSIVLIWCMSYKIKSIWCCLLKVAILERLLACRYVYHSFLTLMLFQTDLISSVQKKGTFLKHSFYFFLYNENEWGLGSSSKLTKKASWKYHKTWLVLYIMSLMKSYYIFVWWTDQKMLLTENEVTMFDSQKINNLVTNQMDTVFKVSSLIRLMWISEQCFIFSMFVILRHCMIFFKDL